MSVTVRAAGEYNTAQSSRSGYRGQQLQRFVFIMLTCVAMLAASSCGVRVLTPTPNGTPLVPTATPARVSTSTPSPQPRPTDAVGPTPTPQPLPTATTFPASPCANGVIVRNPEENPVLVRDCAALLDMKGLLSDGGLRWKTTDPIGTWHGVGIGRSSNRVEILDLTISGMNSRIPKDLVRLTNLRELRIDGDNWSAVLPPELGELASLEVLHVFGRGLRGEIPPELGQLTNLREMWIWAENLSGEIPPELGQLKNLETLSLAESALAGEIPASLGQLSKLRRAAPD